MLATRPTLLADITNVRVSQSNKPLEATPATVPRACGAACATDVTSPSTTASTPLYRTHEPYRWKCLAEEDTSASRQLSFTAEMERMEEPLAPFVALPVAAAPTSCRVLVQFKCHQGEFASPIAVDRGQFVVVQGDRGIDIGVVIRINTDTKRSYVERTGPTGSILRHATQREVDYWATELKADEAAAVDFCQQRVQRSHLNMEVRHAEFQFDKKKLTFYYDSRARVDFVQLLKELYREYGCRIWMEKVRSHE